LRPLLVLFEACRVWMGSFLVVVWVEEYLDAGRRELSVGRKEAGMEMTQSLSSDLEVGCKIPVHPAAPESSCCCHGGW